MSRSISTAYQRQEWKTNNVAYTDLSHQTTGKKLAPEKRVGQRGLVKESEQLAQMAHCIDEIGPNGTRGVP
jgi:hypothetical protein